MATNNARAIIVTDTKAGTLTWHEVGPVVDKKRTPGKVLFGPIKPSAYPAPIQALAMLTVGFRNKFMDSYSDPDSDVVEMLQAMDAQLKAGQWNAKGEAGERATLMAQAVANITKKPLADVVAFIARASDEKASAKDKEVLATYRAHIQVKQEMARITKERADRRAAELAEAAKGAPKPAALPTF